MGIFIDMLNDLPSEAKRRLLLGWLPILLVIVLLCVFGGLPPTSWGLTIRLFALGDALKTVQASTVSQYFNVLLIQSVCTFIAWFLVILAVVSEVFAFKAMQTQLRISRLQAKLSLSSNALATANAATPAPVAPAVVALPAPVEPVVVTPPPAPIPVEPAAVSKESANFETLPMPRSYGVRVTIDDTPDEYPANPFVGKTADAKSTTKNRGVQISSKQHDQPDPFDVQDGTLDLFDKKDNVEEPIFVFGNPFEGDLPEVFTYDKDLQKAVEGLRTTSASKQSSDESKDADTGKMDLDESDEG